MGSEGEYAGDEGEYEGEVGVYSGEHGGYSGNAGGSIFSSSLGAGGRGGGGGMAMLSMTALGRVGVAAFLEECLRVFLVLGMIIEQQQ